MNGYLKIGELAKKTYMNAKTLRYYEEIGLLKPVKRERNGYRLYGTEAIARLEFIKQGKRVGLNLAEIGELVEVVSEGECPCPHLEELLEKKLVELDRHITELTFFRRELQRHYDTLRSKREMPLEACCQGMTTSEQIICLTQI